jgi:hypothetical protein
MVSQFTVLPQADPATSPELKVVRAANGIQLSWPAWATNFALQSAITLGNTTDWSDEGLKPDPDPERNVVVLPGSSPNKFYRLKRH